MTMQRSDRDWAMLKNEYNICKKKLDSKKEGLKILMKDLEQCQIERDIYKNKVCQLQQELDELKELLGDHWRDKIKRGSLFSRDESNDKKIKTLTQLIQHTREENQALHNDIASVRQLYQEAQRDNQLLRETLHQHETRRKGSTSETNDKMRLIEQLEESQNKIEELKTDFENLSEEKTEITQERDHFKEKCSRLNTQLSYALHNDDRRIVDIDALVLENKYLKELTKQHKAEKTMMLASVTRYKEALDRRFNKANRLLAYLDVPVSFTQRAFGNHGGSGKNSSNETVHELQRLTKSLTESLTDKDTALKIQRKTNRVLGTRVRELEKKLKTLEISGLWSLQGQNAVVDRISPTESLKENATGQMKDSKPGSETVAGAIKNDVEIEADTDFEDSSWDPYCEKVEALDIKDPRFSDALIDIYGGHASNSNNNNNRGDSPGNVSVDTDSSIDDVIMTKLFQRFKDDLDIETKFGLSDRVLRKTKSCPVTPLKTCNRPNSWHEW